LSEVRQPEMIAIQPATIGAFAGDIAANALRKLLPPSQRIELMPMSLTEGVNFRPLDYSESDPKLHELLAKCPVLAPTEFRSLFYKQNLPGRITLRDFLLVENSTLDGNTSTDTSNVNDTKDPDVSDLSYSGTHLFESAPRRLSDLWLEMQRIGERYPHKPDQQSQPDKAEEMDAPDPAWKEAIYYFARLSLTSLMGEPTLSPQQRAIINNCIAPNPKMKSEWELGRLPLLVYDRVEYRPALKPMSPILNAEIRICLGESKDWHMQVGNFSSSELSARTESHQEPVTGISTVPELPKLSEGQTQYSIRRNTLAELVVFHDLWILGPDGNQQVSPLLPEFRVTGVGWVNVEWSQENKIAILPWLVPRFQSFWEFDLFLGSWNKFLRSESISGINDMLLQRLLFTWIRAGTTVISGQPLEKVPTSGYPNWESLIKILENLSYYSLSQRSELTRDWLVRVAVMLMQETGLPSYMTAHFSSSVMLKDFWQREHKQITHLRAIRLGDLVQKGLSDLAEELRDTTLDFDLNNIFKPSQELVYKMAGLTPPPPLLNHR